VPIWKTMGSPEKTSGSTSDVKAPSNSSDVWPSIVIGLVVTLPGQKVRLTLD